MLSTSSLSRRRFGLGVEAPVLSTSSLSRRRFGLGDEAPERTPQVCRLRLPCLREIARRDAEDASERSPDPAIDRRVSEFNLRPLRLGCRSARESRDRFGLGAGVEDSASRSARESHGAMDGECPPPECTCLASAWLQHGTCMANYDALAFSITRSCTNCWLVSFCLGSYLF